MKPVQNQTHILTLVINDKDAKFKVAGIIKISLLIKYQYCILLENVDSDSRKILLLW